MGDELGVDAMRDVVAAALHVDAALVVVAKKVSGGIVVGVYNTTRTARRVLDMPDAATVRGAAHFDAEFRKAAYDIREARVSG